MPSVTSSSTSPKAASTNSSTVSSLAAKAASAESKENSSSQFVFGQNLTDRAANFGQFKNGSKDEAAAGGGKSQEEETTKVEDQDIPNEKTKTLSESAAEYCETRNRKVEYNEVELITGEEDESNVFQMSAKVTIEKGLLYVIFLFHRKVRD